MTELEDLSARVDELARMVGDLAELITQPRTGVSPEASPALQLVRDAGPRVDEDALGDLDAWVSWAVNTYEIERWPTCWKEHGGVVLELTGFRLWWLEASAEGGQVLVNWHESWWRFLGRMRRDATPLSRCQGGRNHEHAGDGAEAAVGVRPTDGRGPND
ncbi:MAG: hypothetical protein JOZ75_00770 [Candidatus Dormibacteraeota bacterium]|nr:hypothetical protein [Candidatus Dormibacteraeota bacterium]